MPNILSNINLKNNLVASSSPLTESLERLLCCYEAGFSAAILKSAANYSRTGTGYGRKVVYISDGYYADSSFEREILTIQEGLELFCSAQQKCPSDMLLIPSISAATLNPEDWIESCSRFVCHGAKVIQLDFFYLGSLDHNTAFFEKLKSLLAALVNQLDCIVMPKLNINFNPNAVCEVMSNSGIEIVSLLDSMREIPNQRYGLHPETTSYFGIRQLPYTINYLKTAKQYNFKVCAGGGVNSYNDMKCLLENGADLIQVASYILKRDFSATKDLLPNEDFSNKSIALLKHNPWCDYTHRGNCEMCDACLHPTSD